MVKGAAIPNGRRSTMAQPTDELQKFYELLNRFDTGILVTHIGPNGLHGRPMAVAQVEPNCDVWFLTGLDTPKIEEIRFNDDVLITFQNKRDEFVTLSGRAELVRDSGQVAEIWREPFKVWFPKGQADPNIALLHVHARQGEYWDNAGINRISYLFESVKAYASGEKPNIREGSQHGKVNI